ncbi:hypothetical protein [Brevundimonas viscosa]|uniref:Uncharacterized protein n=1 Tax=Brevundimonas viscosa TaxID=871741 RepID=A0A1I6SSU1_9CAUL|nr:hypothetical protein [Brevundimonas viscosa]SFS79990.1 hypothetical protein SAMN05192570_2637 [Brevundimonas viscosa]
MITVLAATAAGCASVGGGGEPVAIGEAIEVQAPPGFRLEMVGPGEGWRFRRYRLGRSTGDLCTFRVTRPAVDVDPAALAARLVEGELDSARSAGITDADAGIEPAAPGRPERRYVTASFSLHATIHTDHSFWVWREGPDLLAVTRSCQSSDGAEARRALADAFRPVFLTPGAQGEQGPISPARP